MELFCVAVAVAVVGEGEGEWLCDDCGWGGDFGGGGNLVLLCGFCRLCRRRIWYCLRLASRIV
jgi:hypothetical protein